MPPTGGRRNAVGVWSMLMGKRIYWIDNLKAIGIFLVVLGHCPINPQIRHYIYSFHMPLFFFISGYLFNRNRYENFRIFLIRKFRTLIIPYFTFAFTSYLFWLIIVRNLSIRGESLRVSPIKPLLGIFYSIGVDGWSVPLDAALWFLTCLFLVEILFWFISSMCKKTLYLMFILISLAALGYTGSLFAPIRLPWSMDVALTAVVFYGVGCTLKRKIEDLTGSVSIKFILLPCLFLISVVFCFLNGRIHMNSNYYNNIFFFYISAFAGILCCLMISKLLRGNVISDYIGRNTIIIVGLSGVSRFFIRGIYYLVFKQLLDISKCSIGMGIFWACFQILSLVPFMYIINTYCPFILGRDSKKLKSGGGVVCLRKCLKVLISFCCGKH